MSLRAIDLLGHMKPNVASTISADVARWGPGFSQHIYFAGCFVGGPQRDAFLSKPYYIYRPYEAAWEKMSAHCHAWQQTIIPVKEKATKSETEGTVRRLSRG